MGEGADGEHYDPNDVWVLEVNSRNKVKSIRKLILEKIKLLKKANILVYKKDQAPQIVSESQPKVEQNMWVPMTEQDNEQCIKSLTGQQIAFKAYFDITVQVDNRG